ncbi:MAG: cation transporter [Halobacteriovoraceae bacterium]|nr:cation transporter [Halobacteriovoraceae bacterium]|tara:strand:+ start:716 stop:1588 length:873 start_codon:yes stop_codon:yes gene_type:complete
MGGHHHHHHHHHHAEGKNILIAFFLNFTFALIEIVGGYFTNSVAIMSDAIHDLGDSMALLFSYFAEKLSVKEADDSYTFGYRRFSILSAFINGLILLGGSLFVLYEAIQRLFSPQAVEPKGMIALAILGIAVNGFAAYRLSKSQGINSKMVMFHLLEDLLGWVAVLLVSIILLFKPWYSLDAILSILISFLILKGVYKNLVKVIRIFLQKFPEDLSLTEIKNEIKSLPEVKDIHEIKGWSIDDQSYYLRFHLKVAPETQMKTVDEIKRQVKDILTRHHVEYSTIEFESSC